VAVAALAAILLVTPPGSRAAEPPLATGRAVPFKLKSVTGQSLELSRLLEQGPVLLDFWATWCKPCAVSLPELEGVHRRHAARGLTVIGVSVDGPRNYSKVRPFATRYGLTYPIALDEDGRLQQQYQVSAVPTSVLIGPDGRIVHFGQGFKPGDTERLEAEVEKLLAPAAADSAR
jgi:peroxiredoxin